MCAQVGGLQARPVHTQDPGLHGVTFDPCRGFPLGGTIRGESEVAMAKTDGPTQGQRKRPLRDKRHRKGRTTRRASEIESKRVMTRQHSTARGASGRR